MDEQERQQLENDFKWLETKLKQLRAEFNQYFVGARKSPPNVTEIQIRKVIRKYAGSDKLLRGVDRFRYYNFIAKYNTLREYWGRRIRTMEEGINIGTRAHIETTPEGVIGDPADKHRSHQVSKDVNKLIKDPFKQKGDMRLLYISYMRNMKKLKSSTQPLKFEEFRGVIRKKMESMSERHKSNAVNFRVVLEDDKVKLKAKAVKLSDRKDLKSGKEPKTKIGKHRKIYKYWENE